MDHCRGIGLWSVIGILAVVLNLVCTPAEATMIEIEPDNYAVGTNLSNVFHGVTLNRYSYRHRNSGDQQPIYDPVYSTLMPGPSGPLGFGYYEYARDAAQCWSGYSTCVSFSALLLQFDTPVNYVELAYYSSGADPGQIFVFGADLQIIGNCSGSPWDGPCSSVEHWGYDYRNGTISFTINDRAPLIYSAIIAGDSGSTYLDSLRYNTVPEPSAIFLLAMGMVGLGWWSRKRCGMSQAGGSTL